MLAEQQIPAELWRASTLHIPVRLRDLYRKQLEVYDLMDCILSKGDVSGPVGGPSEEETLEHFAFRYGVSVCRVESVVIDPAHAFMGISKDLLTTFSDGIVSLLDAPCGTGAAGTAILSTIGVLRERGVIPKLPLTIKITGGDISQTALKIYREILKDLEPSLKSAGILVQFSPLLWDASQPEKTAKLVDTWFANSLGVEEYFSVIANFSGFAGKSFTAFQRSFEHMHERLHDKASTVLWVEPDMKGAIRYLDKITKLMRNAINWYTSWQEEALRHGYFWFHPFRHVRLPCRVLVYKYERF